MCVFCYGTHGEHLFAALHGCKIYLSGTSRRCQRGANSHFGKVFSTFGLMHQNVVTLGGYVYAF